MIKVGALTKKWDSQTCTGGNWADMSENLELLHFSKLLRLAEAVACPLFFVSWFFFFFFFFLVFLELHSQHMMEVPRLVV